MSSNLRRTEDGSVTFAVTANALPPAARIAATTASACSVLVLVFTATVRPSAARLSAITAPSPLPAPVTRAISDIGSAIARHGLREQLGDVVEVVDLTA